MWATIFGLGGYFLGSKVEQFSGPVGIVFLVLAVIILVVSFIFLRRNEKRLEDEAERALPGPLDAHQEREQNKDVVKQ